MKRLAFSKSNLEHLQGQLSVWRRKQTGRARLPEAIWIAATDLARTHGTGLVARTLRLDYYKLRNRVSGKTGPVTTRPAFVEIRGPQPPGVVPEEGGKVELFDGRGAGMTLPMRGDLPNLGTKAPPQRALPRGTLLVFI